MTKLRFKILMCGLGFWLFTGTYGASINSIQAAASSQTVPQPFFTPTERQQIAQYRAQANVIGNPATLKQIYRQRPLLKGRFETGKLTPQYIQATVDWINFFRHLFDLPSVSNGATWNRAAQYGAATLAAANANVNTDRLSHDLTTFDKPAYVNDKAWQRGRLAVAQSNISSGMNSPYSVVTDYLNEINNISATTGPGHRQWLLGNIHQVGIGKAGRYSAIKVIGQSNQVLPPINKFIAFPSSGLFPIELAKGGPWSLSLPNPSAGQLPRVMVYDDTANMKVSVHTVNIDSSWQKTLGAVTKTKTINGYFGTNLWFTPDTKAIKVNHRYTITVDGLSGTKSAYTYSTKLFSLGMKAN